MDCRGSRKLRAFYLELLICGLLMQIAGICGVFVRMGLIDAIAYGESRTIVIRDLIVLLSLILMESVLDFIYKYFELKCTRNYTMRAPELLADKCATLPLGVIERKETAETVYASKEYFSKSFEATKGFVRFINLAVTFVALIILLYALDPLMIVMFLMVLVVTFYLSFVSSKESFDFWKRYMRNTRRYNYFSDIQTKREFAYERRTYHFSDAMDARFSEAFDLAAAENRKSGLARFRGQAYVEGIAICVSIFTMFYFASPGILSLATIGTYAAITELVSKLIGIVSACPEGVFSIRDFYRLKGELEEFLCANLRETQNQEVYDKKEQMQEEQMWEEKCQKRQRQKAQNPEDFISVDALIVFKNVSFAYDSEPVIRSFDFSFQKGVHYGLVGVNGAGKTTLAKLLLRLYRPTEGRILSDGLMSTAIFQDYQIYPATVREFLKMGNDDKLSDDDINVALKRIGCSLPTSGLDTPLSLLTEEGTLLSKGQLQRLAIARVCLSNADFVILDEPTASLDPVSEKQIYEELMEILEGRTCIFISHRLGAVARMDEILFMSEGRIIEHGTHEQLMCADGLYRELYETQRGMYVDE